MWVVHTEDVNIDKTHNAITFIHNVQKNTKILILHVITMHVVDLLLINYYKYIVQGSMMNECIVLFFSGRDRFKGKTVYNLPTL